jgi:hypothetical protein
VPIAKWLTSNTPVLDCPTCGRFALDGAYQPEVKLLADDRWRVSAVTRYMSLRGAPVLLALGTADDGCVGFACVSALELVQTRFPHSVGERLDRALANVARLSRHLGAIVPLGRRQSWSVFFAQNDGEAFWVAKALGTAGYITTSAHTGGFHLSLTASGWNRVAELEREGGQETSEQAFVAMWFGSDKETIGDRTSQDFCTDAFLGGFQSAIAAAGYRAMRVDFKEFNDDIMDHVVAEIRRSRFVVADFTGHRPGVYYEAGFARGLGLPVIFTCNKDHFHSTHFDTNHMNHLIWESVDVLANKLCNRIRATIGQGPIGETEK